MLGRRAKADRQAPSRIKRAQHDPDRFIDVYEAHYDQLLRFLTRKVFDAEAAFDLHAELFALAFERRGQFRGSTVAEDEGWLFAIAVNLLRGYWRDGEVERRAMERLRLARPVLDDDAIERIEELADLAVLAPVIVTALDLLPVDQRRAVHLRVVEELSYEEVAQAEGVSNQVIRARVSRGLRALAAHIATDDALERA